jgi:hypothetical protein
VPESHLVAELTRRLDRIQQLTAELAKCQRDGIERVELAERMDREILGARQALQPIT